MALTVDLLQAKNLAIVGITTAPALASYPTDGNIKGSTLPLALSWPVTASLDDAGAILSSTYRMDYYIGQVGINTWKVDKATCDTLWYAVLAAWNLTGDNVWLRTATTPHVEFVRGSLTLTGYENIIKSPSDELYHGFSATIRIIEHMD